MCHSEADRPGLHKEASWASQVEQARKQHSSVTSACIPSSASRGGLCPGNLNWGKQFPPQAALAHGFYCSNFDKAIHAIP